MTSCEEVLERAAKDGSIEPTDWSRLFDTVLSRIEQNVYKAFIIPSIPETKSPPAAIENPSSPLKTQTSDPASADTNPSPATKIENAPSSSPPPSAPQPTSTTQTSIPTHYSDLVLPGPLLTTWTYVRTTLTKQFSSYPPHTIQRLSELTLRPHQHYRFLPAYLNALDRVVSVSSGSNSFPLPAIELAATPGAVVNGAAITSNPSPLTSLDSDESLGGALLTPIPWLRNGSGSGHSSPMRQPNGDQEGTDAVITDGDATMADGPMRGNGAVTQGELMRQEQEASGPLAPVASAEGRQHPATVNESAGMMIDDDGEGGEQGGEGDGNDLPHARGPERIGLEDTGLRPQEVGPGIGQALNMEAAVGRASSARGSTPGDDIGQATPTTSEATPESTSEAGLKRDSDGDVEITDVDGITEEEKRDANVTGDDTAPDAVDATAR